MRVRHEVLAFAELGALPDSSASEEAVASHQEHLHRITPPLTDDEAALLVASFGPDECFGLAWTLLHLIETAPSGVPIKVEPSSVDNIWVRRLWRRSHVASPGKIRADFAAGKISVDDLLLNVEPMLHESASDVPGQAEARRIANQIELTIFTKSEPERTTLLLELLDAVVAFAESGERR